MRKLIFALLIAGLVSSTAYAAIPSEPTEPGLFKRMTGLSQDTATRVYQLVRYASKDGAVGASNSPTLTAGSAVVWDLTSDDGVTVRTTTTSGDTAFAGITTAAILTCDSTTSTSAADDAGRRNWGYIQVYGPITIARVAAGGTNANSAGDAFITSRDEGTITSTELPTVLPTIGSVASFNSYSRVAQGRGGFFYNAGSGTKTQDTVFVKAE